jgi:hypothetical protein
LLPEKYDVELPTKQYLVISNLKNIIGFWMFDLDKGEKLEV